MIPEPDRQPIPAGANAFPDAALLLGRLEQRILEGGQSDQIRALLQKEALWRRLSLHDRLRWADLAQMSEDTDTARRVLESVHRDHPDCATAWHRHLELLTLLGRTEAMGGLLARARPYIDQADQQRWCNLSAAPDHETDEDLQAAAIPFERHHHQMAALLRFMELFAGRQDCFARQWADRKSEKQGYVPERRPMTPADLQAHLGGHKTHGIYLMLSDGGVRVAVIDADLRKSLRGRALDAATRNRVRSEARHLITRLTELSRDAGAHPVVEFSGSKGYHFWYFFQTPVAAGPLRTALKRLTDQISGDLTAFELEVFPKQDQPGGKGFGNLVKLPLGLHRLSGKRSFFFDCRDRAIPAQLDFLATVSHTDPQALIAHFTAGQSAQVVVHPRYRAWAEAHPELYQLRGACAPLSQVMSLCLDGGRISLREEKILYQTIGFLPNGPKLLHHLLRSLPDYNPHQVDYRLSRLRGTPLGCRRIHSLLGSTVPICHFTGRTAYAHPLLHIDGWQEPTAAPAEKARNLTSALEHLQSAIMQVERFLK